jgi:uracil-DNA glycosylase family 4
MDTFDEIDIEIGNCNICTQFSPLIKSQKLRRGKKSKIMVIGLSPGQKETEQGLAFSGQAGKKLFEWLKKAGIGSTENEIRDKVYFTSLIKCQKEDLENIKSMFVNCQQLLKKQVNQVSPTIIITLGSAVFNILLNKNMKTKAIVGKIFTFNEINDTPLFPDMSILYGISYVIPFPHPSGLNRWLNEFKNKKHLIEAIQLLKKYENEE